MVNQPWKHQVHIKLEDGGWATLTEEFLANLPSHFFEDN